MTSVATTGKLLQLDLVHLDIDEMAELIEFPKEQWSGSCHAVSIHIVQKGAVPGGRVARGYCEGVTSQHSWIVQGDPYRPLQIIDPTLWCYREELPQQIWHSTNSNWHWPKGQGSIFEYGKPTHAGGRTIELNRTGLSAKAKRFLDLLGPLDMVGWAALANAPVGGWPAKEIFERMLENKHLGPLIPIDVVGMLTDRNPEGLYF